MKKISTWIGFILFLLFSSYTLNALNLPFNFTASSVSAAASVTSPNENHDIARINSNGQHLLSILDHLDVEHHWLPKQPIHWATGETDDTEKPLTSHCSAFVAAAAAANHIYILRPPEHPQMFLANAQYDWLQTKGRSYGWNLLNNPWQAQSLANRGYLVIAAFKNQQANKPGHIVIIRPSNTAYMHITDEGPHIIQAGMQNYNCTTLQTGFKHHPGAWVSSQNYTVLFYSHKIDNIK
ncbi:hypothetical protein NXG27_01790 [Megasphaera paucivorans]|uniref:Peptidase C39-like domain-containing protein n=1 Tax=Megasphaera paucivorans TaxID=349095 RepID=A0A1G9SYS5_9FIRM|nr:hypothetical protein [Megasphaera paucivorans]SDM40005.1 hypothetical protein SAMN05660299_00805 [Megasphaera paucivorans]